MTYSQFVGIDIAAASAQVAILNGPQFSIKQSPAGYRQVDQTLRRMDCPPASILIVMEATGVYWLPTAQFLYQAGYTVSVVNPAQSHYFSKTLLARTKTDLIDACLLALFAAQFEPAPWTPDPDIYDGLQQTLVQRDAIQTAKQQAKNRLHALKFRLYCEPAVLARYQEQLDLHDRQFKATKSELDLIIRRDPAWYETAQLLRSIKGFGPVVTAWLLVATRNFTSCSTPEQLVSYAGLCPRLFQSGSSVQRRAALGFAPHARLRQALYMAALSAVQHNPIIRRYYQRLLAQGKLKKVALCACARKLIHIAWAVVMKQQPFDPAYA